MDLKSSRILQNQLLQDPFIRAAECISSQTANSPWEIPRNKTDTRNQPSPKPQSICTQQELSNFTASLWSKHNAEKGYDLYFAIGLLNTACLIENTSTLCLKLRHHTKPLVGRLSLRKRPTKSRTLQFFAVQRVTLPPTRDNQSAEAGQHLQETFPCLWTTKDRQRYLKSLFNSALPHYSVIIRRLQLAGDHFLETVFNDNRSHTPYKLLCVRTISAPIGVGWHGLNPDSIMNIIPALRVICQFSASREWMFVSVPSWHRTWSHGDANAAWSNTCWWEKRFINGVTAHTETWWQRRYTQNSVKHPPQVLWDRPRVANSISDLPIHTHYLKKLDSL